MVKCCILCTGECYRDCGLSFHMFPRDPTRRAIWINALPNRKRRVTHTAVICSRHFKQDDYEMRESRRVLKKDAVPSLWLDNCSKRCLGKHPNSAFSFRSVNIPPREDQVETSIETPKLLLNSLTPMLRLRPKNEVVSNESSLQDNNLDENQDSTGLFVTLDSIADVQIKNETPTRVADDPLQLKLNREAYAGDFDESEAQYVEYLEDSGSSYKPSDSSSEEDQNEVPQINKITSPMSVKKDSIDNVTSNERDNIEKVTSNEKVNIEKEALAEAVARIDKIAEDLSKNRDDEFDGFGKYVAASLRALPTKMAIVATKEIHNTLTETQLKSVAYRRGKSKDTQPTLPTL